MMEPTNIEFVGDPCGQHGPYTFYKAFKYNLNDKIKILSLGQFFFVKISIDSPVCIGEIQLVWQDRNHEDLQLASVRLYFLPEHSPDGRQPYNGEDEVLAETEKVVLSIEDLLRWRVEDGVSWPYGRRAIHDIEITKGCHQVYCPPGDSTEADQLIEMFSANNAGIQFSQDVESIKKSLCGPCVQSPCDNTEVIVLSYSQYCRYRGVLERLRDCTNLWLKSALISAIGGFTVKSPDTRIHFCRDTFDHPELEDHEYRQDHLAPNLKGRPRKKKLAFKKDWSPGDSDSNDSVEHLPSKVRRANSLPLGLQKINTSNHLNPHHRQSLGGSSIQGLSHADIKPLKPIVSHIPVSGGHGNRDWLKVKSEVKPSQNHRKPCTKLSNTSEKTFMDGLHTFMRLRRTPIGRMPTLGFKEINLYEFYLYAHNFGGYEQVTNKRLWKNIYDRLGGNPSNTSAATCTRRHYEKLLLPYEMHLRGLEAKVHTSTNKRKPLQKGISNTIRNHLKDNLQNNSTEASVKQEVSEGTTSHVANGRELSGSSGPPALYPLNVPNTNLVANNKVKVSTESIVSTATTQTLVMPLNVPSSLGGASGMILPPGITLPPGVTLPPGMLLGLPQLPIVTAVPNVLPNSSMVSSINSATDLSKTINVTQKMAPSMPPNVEVLPNGTIVTSTSLSHRPVAMTTNNKQMSPYSRPSVIQHASNRRPIMNPAPRPRPNIPNTVYGPPNMLPSVCSLESNPNHVSQYGAGSSHAALQPNTGNLLPKPREQSSRNNLSSRIQGETLGKGQDSVRVLENQPEVIRILDDQPTDLSMRRTMKPSPVEHDAKLPVTQRRIDGDTPLNLSLKAHNMPKTTSAVCVPKLPVNPFRPINKTPIKSEASNTQRNGQLGDVPSHGTAMQTVQIQTPGAAQRIEVPMMDTAGLFQLPGINNTKVEVPLGGTSIGGAAALAATASIPNLLGQPSLDLLSLGALPIVHPAFPFPLNYLPSSSSMSQSLSSPPTVTSVSLANSSLVSNFNTGLLPPGMFYPGLSAFALPSVGTQLYPHLYQPAPSNTSASSASENKS